MAENETTLQCGKRTDTVCVHANQIYDSCRSKECLEDLRVYLTESAQRLVEQSVNVRVKSAEIIWVFTDVEKVPFNKGYYTVDIRMFFKIRLDVYSGSSRPTEVEGLSVFDKKVVLFGSEGNAKIFESKYKEDSFDPQFWSKTNMPKAVVEVVNPVVLGVKTVDACEKSSCSCDRDYDLGCIPECIHRVFDDSLCCECENKRVFITLGLFSIIRLEREVQLLIPAIDFCIPSKECVTSTNECNPCDLFETLQFPVDEFFPPLSGEEDCNNECE